MAKTYKKIAGVWTPIKKIFKNIAGTWTEVKKAYKKVDGVWKQVHSGATEFTFSSSITATASTGILLSSYVNPNSSDEFIITVNSGVNLLGKTGTTGTNGSNLGSCNFWTSVSNCRGKYYGQGTNGGTGGVGGKAIDLTGFSGKTVTINNSGTIKGGTGGKGGNGGNALSGGYACGSQITSYGGCGGAGGVGGVALYGTAGVTLTVTGNAVKTGNTGASGSAGTNGIFRDGDCSCFIKGQLVLMADGTLKAIEDIRIGDLVQGAYGKDDINVVKYLQRPPRGNRTIYDIEGLLVSDEHGILNGSRDGFLYLDIQNHYAEANMYQPCLDENFNEIQVWFAGVQDGVTKKENLVVGSTVATSKGFKTIENIIPTDIQDEMLYHLVLDGGSRTYCISDTYVSGYTDDSIFDYKEGKLR